MSSTHRASRPSISAFSPRRRSLRSAITTATATTSSPSALPPEKSSSSTSNDSPRKAALEVELRYLRLQLLELLHKCVWQQGRIDVHAGLAADSKLASQGAARGFVGGSKGRDHLCGRASCAREEA